MKIDKKSRNLLIALTIGDGYIHNKNGTLSFRHCPKQKEYVEWKSNELKKNGINNTGAYWVKNHIWGGYELRTYSMKFLKLLRKIIYKNGKKTITRKLLNRLDKRAIAIWYMDDGSLSNRKDKNGTVTASILTLCTCTTKENNQIIIDYFDEVWGIKFGQRKMKEHFALICATREARKFIKIVEETVKEIQCMHYKLDVKKEPLKFSEK